MVYIKVPRELEVHRMNFENTDRHSDQRSQGKTEPSEMGSGAWNDCPTTTTVYSELSEGAITLARFR